MHSARALALVLVVLSGCRPDTKTEFVTHPTDSRMPAITLSEDTTFLTEPRLPDGTPDYAAFLNATLGEGVSAENNAAALIAPALGMQLDDEIYELMGVDPETVGSESFMGSVLWEDFDAYLRSRSGESEPLSSCDRRATYEAFLEENLRNEGSGPCAALDCPATAGWVGANDEALSAIQAASLRASYFIPKQEGVSLAPQGSGNLLGLRTAAQAFRARAMLALGRSAWSDAANDVRTAYRLSEFTNRGWLLIDKLIAINQRQIATDALTHLASSPDFRPDEARELLARLSMIEDITYDHQTEKLYGLSGVLMLWSAGGSENWKEILEPGDYESDSIPEGIYQVPSHLVDWDEALRFVNRSWKRAEEGHVVADEGWASLLEEPELTKLLDRVENDVEARRELARAVAAGIQVLPVAQERAFLSLNESRAQSRFALATLAMALFRVEQGRWPEKLGEVPGLEIDAPGYEFRLHATGPHGVAISASPRKHGETGAAAFCWDGNGGMLIDYAGAKPGILGGRCHFPSPAKTTRAGSKQWVALVLAGVGLGSLLLLGFRPSEGTAAVVVVLVIGTLLLLVGYAVVRFRTFASERISDVHDEISTARSVAARLPELRREVERRRDIHSAIKELVPESLETEATETKVVEWVEKMGVTVEGRWLMKSYTPHLRARLTVCIAEEGGRVEPLYELEDELPSAVRLVDTEKTEGGIEVVLDWYALRREKGGKKVADELCERLENAPPFSISRDVRLACDEWERLRPVVEYAAEYSGELRDLERREQMLEQIR